MITFELAVLYFQPYMIGFFLALFMIIMLIVPRIYSTSSLLLSPTSINFLRFSRSKDSDSEEVSEQSEKWLVTLIEL